jgi:hypothetical protein
MPASKAQRAITAERRSKALQLRLAGTDYTTIAAALGYADRAAACKDITRALEIRTREQQQSADVLRGVEVARLDLLQEALWSSALGGDTKTVEAVLKVIDRRIKLLGLDQAQKMIDSAVDAWLNHLTATPTDDDPDSDPDSPDNDPDNVGVDTGLDPGD